MTSHLITYDLNRPGQNYNNLFEAIKKIGLWWHCLDSTWIVKSDLSASSIRDSLLSHIDKNDKILVVTLTGEAAWYGLNENCSSWLKNHL